MELESNDILYKEAIAKAKKWVLRIGVSALIILFFGMSYTIWAQRNKLREAELYIQASDNTIAMFKVKIQSDSTYKLEMAQRFGTEQNARLLAEDNAKKLKSISAVVKTRVEVRVDTFNIPYHITNTGNEVDSNESPCDGVPFGTAFYLSDSTKYIAGVIDTTQIRIDSLGLPVSDIIVTIGTEKTGLLKKPKPVVIVDFDNPYLKPVSGNNIIVKDTRKKPLLLSRGAMFAYGLILGFTGYVLIN